MVSHGYDPRKEARWRGSWTVGSICVLYILYARNIKNFMLILNFVINGLEYFLNNLLIRFWILNDLGPNYCFSFDIILDHKILFYCLVNRVRLIITWSITIMIYLTWEWLCYSPSLATLLHWLWVQFARHISKVDRWNFICFCNLIQSPHQPLFWSRILDVWIYLFLDIRPKVGIYSGHFTLSFKFNQFSNQKPPIKEF